jgi:16S rRNA (uracil1498-N3)-methyltransferase
VQRLNVGDAIRVFDGRGHEWLATVDSLARGMAVVRLGGAVAAVPEPGVAVTLCASVLKADHMDEVVRDAVMLGVRAIRPLLTEHTEVTARTIERGARVARWQRIAVASAKQCGRAVVPAVADPVSLGDAIAGPASSRVVLVEPGAQADAVVSLARLPRVDAVELFVGPEGGWSPTEVEMMSAAGGMLVTLGRQTLRAAAAPTVAISALRAVWGDL